MKSKELVNIFFRYTLIIILSLGNLYIFYLIFTPLTVFYTYSLLEIFFNAQLNGNFIRIGCTVIEIVESCVAGSAYFLLTFLNLATPMKIKKRVLVLLTSFIVFFVINVWRIFIFSLFLKQGYLNLFNYSHFIFWFFLSTIFVILIWFFEVKFFNIRKIPFISDIKKLFNLTKK